MSYVEIYKATSDKEDHWTPAPKLAHEFDYVTILIEAVAAGVGVAIVPRCLLDQVLELGKVAAPFNHPVESDRGFYFCGPKAKSDLAAVRLFREWLFEEVATYSS